MTYLDLTGLELNTDSLSSAESWLKKTESADIVSKIKATKAFARLGDISFLGAIGLTHSYRTKYKTVLDTNRLEHSLSVATLANYVSTLRNYDQELKKHLIVAALLHDIGHFPLSHSAEPFIKQATGYDHHEMGKLIIKGDLKIAKDLFKILSEETDINFVLDLLDKKVSATEGGDLFSSQINIDTIDGVYRTNRFINNERKDIFLIAHAAFSDTKNNNTYDILDSFWEKKSFIYKNFINAKNGVIADKVSNQYFFSHSKKIELEVAIVSEKNWKNKFKVIQALKSMANNRDLVPEWFEPEYIEYTDRTYFIDKNEKNTELRYLCKKRKEVLEIKSKKHASTQETFSLNY